MPNLSRSLLILLPIFQYASAFSMQTANRIDIAETAQRDVYTMNDWARHFGVQQVDGVELASYDGVDYFTATQANIAAGSPVMMVPNDLLISASKAQQELGPALQQAEMELSNGKCAEEIPLFRVFIKLLVEYEKGPDSAWYPYLNAMPRFFNNGAAMTFACFDVLPVYSAWLAISERINLVNFEKAAQFVPLLGDETKANHKLLKWAYCVASTRALDLQGDKVLAPLADMFNHGSTETEVDIQYDDQGNVMVYATRDVPGGSPLRMSLGDPTNPSPLFAKYGFLDESSPATFCKAMKLQTEMEQLDYTFSDLLFYKNGDISPAVYDVFLYAALRNDPESQQGFYQAVMNGDENTKGQFHQHFFPMTLEALKKHVNEFLGELDNLSSTARTYNPSTHPRVPVILAHNTFVKETFLRVKENLDNM